MKKRIFSMLVAICLVLSMIPTVSGTAFASTIYVSDTDVTYEVDGGNIYFDASTGTITGCDKSVTSAVIPEAINGVKVTSIGGSAFRSCESLKSVKIPSSVTEIGYMAFAYCELLDSIEIPESITSIQGLAFAYCTSLKRIDIPASAKYIAQPTQIVSGCSALEEIVVAADNINFKSVDGCLYNKTGTEFLKCPEGKVGVASIENGAEMLSVFSFQDCTKVTAIKIPSTFTGRLDQFSGCTALERIEVDSKNSQYKSIDGCVYSIDGTQLLVCGAGKVGVVEIQDGTEEIGRSGFNNCSKVTSIKIPTTVNKIEHHAFSNCTTITSIDIPSSVTNIEYCAFSGCEALECVKIPYGITEISSLTFYDCKSLAKVEIPDSVTSIAANAFSGCSNLQYIAGKKGSYAEQYANENNITFVATHTHCVCGAEHKNIGDHTAENELTFTAWTDELAEEQNGEGKTAANSLPSVAGSYYLTKDVALLAHWEPVSGIYMCLNGKKVTNITEKDGYISLQIICLNDGVELTLTDCAENQGKIVGGNEISIDQTVRMRGASVLNLYGGSIEGAGFGNFHPIFGIQLGDNSDEKNAQFNMYGGSIANVRYGIRVRDTLNMYGGNINDCVEYGVEFDNSGHATTATMSGGSIHDCGCGVLMSRSDITFNMSGGSIKNNGKIEEGSYNKANHEGGVDCGAYAIFNLSGGTIEGNVNDQDLGAGVCGGTFNMSGGSVKNNIGGGVRASNITLSGSAQIVNNTLNDKTITENLRVYSGKTITINSLSETAKIGITTETAPTAGNPVTFTSNAVSNFDGKLSSDNADYQIAANQDGSLALKIRKSAGSISAAPTKAKDLTYDGSEKQLITAAGSGTGNVVYSLDKDGTYSDDFASLVETNAGTYRVWYKAQASESYTETAPAYVDVTIKKATPTAADFDITAPGTKGYTGNPTAAEKPSVKSGISGMGKIGEVYYENMEQGLEKTTSAPTNAGTYKVTFNVEAGQNYEAATDIEIGTLTINKIDWNGTKTMYINVPCDKAVTDWTCELPSKPEGSEWGTAVVSAQESGFDETLIDSIVRVSNANMIQFSTNAAAAGTKAKAIINVTSGTNHNAYDIEIIFNAKSREDLSARIVTDGLEIVNKGIYSAQAASYSGRATVSGHSDLNDSLIYEWYKADGTKLENAPKDVGEYCLKVSISESKTDFYKGSKNVDFEITAKPITITGVEATDRDYIEGNTTVSLTGGIPEGNLDGSNLGISLGTGTLDDANAGEGKAVRTAIELTGSAKANYSLTQPEYVTVNIRKIAPSYTVPEELTATKGEKLSDIRLPEGFVWKEPDKEITDIGNNTFYATFTPSDSINYKTVENIVIDVFVNNATVEMSGSIVSWDNVDNAVVRLYEDSSELTDKVIRADMRTDTRSKAVSGTTVVLGDKIETGTKTGTYTQSFTLSAELEDGTYKLAVYKPKKGGKDPYVVSVVKVTVSGGTATIDGVANGEVKMWLYGDVNDDGKITGKDATQVSNYVAKVDLSIGDKSTVYGEHRFTTADINQDEKVNGKDATLISNKVAKVTDSLGNFER